MGQMKKERGGDVMIDGEVRKYQLWSTNLRRRMKLQTRQTFMRQSGIKTITEIGITNQRGHQGRKPQYKKLCLQTYGARFECTSLSMLF